MRQGSAAIAREMRQRHVVAFLRQTSTTTRTCLTGRSLTSNGMGGWVSGWIGRVPSSSVGNDQGRERRSKWSRLVVSSRRAGLGCGKEARSRPNTGRTGPNNTSDSQCRAEVQMVEATSSGVCCRGAGLYRFARTWSNRHADRTSQASTGDWLHYGALTAKCKTGRCGRTEAAS